MTAKTLGQAYPTTTDPVTLYAPTTGREAVISTLVIVNGSTPTTVSVWKRVMRGSALDAAGNINRLLSALPLAANQRLALTEGWTLAPGDTLTVQVGTASTANFDLSGDETAVS